MFQDFRSSIFRWLPCFLLLACDPERGGVDPDGIDPPPPLGSTSKVDTLNPPAEVHWDNPRPQVNTFRDIHFPTSKLGYFVGEKGVILKTTDGGRTFASQKTAPGQLHVVRFFDSDRGIAVGDAGLILSTTDGGDTWKTRYVGSSTFWGLCTQGPGTAMAVGDHGTLLKSRDGGATWTLKNSGLTAGLIDCQFLDSTKAIATSLGILLKSTDGGDSWSRDSVEDIFGNKRGFHLHKLHLDGNGNGYALNFAAPSFTRDGGHSWKPWGDDDDLLYPMAPDHMRDMSITGDGDVFLVGVNGAFLRRRIGEDAPWVKGNLGTPSTLLAVDFPANDTGYAAGESGDIARTVDGGATWEWLSHTETKEDLSAVHFVDGQQGFIVGARGIMLKTSDGGASWDSVAGAATRDLHGVHFLDDEVGCVVGANGTALWTSDGGATWTLGGTGIQERLTAVHVVDPVTAYAAAGLLVIRTGDGGKSWTKVPQTASSLASGWEVGDGLYFDRRQFLASPALAAFPDDDCLCMRVRQDTDSAWMTHAFTGRFGTLAAYAQADSSLFYAVGGTHFYRIESRNRSMEAQDLEVGGELRGVHCPEAGTCFVVGDQGMILKLTLP